MNSLLLNTKDLSELFFNKTTLWGITSNASVYAFCHKLNQSLELNLKRNLDLDLAVKNDGNLVKDIGLFESLELKENIHYFPVYIDDLADEESEIILYCNRYKGNVLIQEQKQFDYLLLTRRCDFVPHLNLLDQYISDEDYISICKKIPLSNQKWKDYLIL